MKNDADAKKRHAAHAALQYLQEGAIVGVGTGSTVNYFIEALSAWRGRLRGAISSSEASSARLRAIGIEVLDLNEVGSLDLYVDGADEATPLGKLIKGGGGALTREKIVAAASREFVCIVDDTKIVQRLGRFALPVEVIPMARTFVTRQLPGRPVWREGFVTDNGNVILDIHGLDIADPEGMEAGINQLAGVVTVGLFAIRGADVLLVGTPHSAGVTRIGHIKPA